MRDASTSPVLPRARLPVTEYRQGPRHPASLHALQPPDTRPPPRVSASSLASEVTQAPARHHRPGPQAVPSRAGCEVQV